MIHTSPQHIDRYRELANIGASWAATAFGNLLGCTVLTQVPTVVDWSNAHEHVGWDTGVFFEGAGDLECVVGLFLPPSARDAVADRLLGVPSKSASEDVLASALAELGNIVAGRSISAIADTLRTRIGISLPKLVMEGAETALAALVEGREWRAGLRIESELYGRDGELLGLLVFVPLKEHSLS